MDDIKQALADANVCLIFTEREEVKAVNPYAYKRLMRTPLIYAGRNIYKVDDLREAMNYKQ